MEEVNKSYREIGNEIMAGGGSGGGGGGADLDQYRKLFEEAKAEIDVEYGDESGTDQYWADVTNAAIDKVDWSEVGNLSAEEVRALTGLEDDADPAWDGYDSMSSEERTTFLEEIASGSPSNDENDTMQREGGDTNMPDQPTLSNSGQGGGCGGKVPFDQLAPGAQEDALAEARTGTARGNGGYTDGEDTDAERAATDARIRGEADLDKSYYEIGNDILRQQEGDPLQRGSQKTRGDQNRYRVMGEEERVRKLGNNARQRRYRAVKEKVGPMKAPVHK